jgi:hypothetical protein
MIAALARQLALIVFPARIKFVIPAKAGTP